VRLKDEGRKNRGRSAPWGDGNGGGKITADLAMGKRLIIASEERESMGMIHIRGNEQRGKGRKRGGKMDRKVTVSQHRLLSRPFKDKNLRSGKALYGESVCTYPHFWGSNFKEGGISW